MVNVLIIFKTNSYKKKNAEMQKCASVGIQTSTIINAKSNAYDLSASSTTSIEMSVKLAEPVSVLL